MRLRCDNIVKKYGIRTVVKGVSIYVDQGEIVGLLGPNGAGKTTSFYMITGLIKPNGGRIFLDDEDITEYPMYRRAQHGLGYLAQEASVFRQMTVENNILSVMEMAQFTREERHTRCEQLIKEFGLQKVRKSKGIQLSGGERRRCEIARALALNPKFILLDEPFAGVDPIAVEDIQMIVAMLKYKNIGVIITDHNVHETLAITDRTYLLYEGSILISGTAEDLANNPDVRKKYLGQSFVLHKLNVQNPFLKQPTPEEKALDKLAHAALTSVLNARAASDEAFAAPMPAKPIPVTEPQMPQPDDSQPCPQA